MYISPHKDALVLAHSECPRRYRRGTGCLLTMCH